MPRLVLMRHGKSDWSGETDDRSRPIGRRGRRQAAEAGDWLAGHLPRIDLALVSSAVRARSTWQVASARLPTPPDQRIDDRLYTGDQRDVLAVVRDLSDDVCCALVVSHDPALSELVSALTDEPVDMGTSCLAVLEAEGPWRSLSAARLLAFGRPPAGSLAGPA